MTPALRRSTMRRKPRSLPTFSISPVSSWRIFCVASCSFRWSSFSRSSAMRRRSRTFRWRVSSFSRRESADSTRPFLSSSSRSFSTSAFPASTSFCMAALSFSSCSRAASPASDRTMTFWTSTYPTRVAAASTPPARPSATAPTTSALTILIVLPLDASEGRSHGEVDLSRLLTRLLVEVQAVVEPERHQRRVEPDPRARGEPEVGRIERRAEPVRVPGVEEEGEAEVGDERDRDEQLRVEEQLLVAADHVPLGVLG